MYKNLNTYSLGISGRLNELIELSLTYKFSGFDLDILALAQQAETRGTDHATRYLSGANIRIGSFELPVDLAADDAEFAANLELLGKVGAIAQAVKATTAVLDIVPYSDTRAYHENFQVHCQRLGQVADCLATYDVSLGLGFLAPAHHREGRWAQFIATPDALLTLIKMVSHPRVGLCLDTWHWHVGGGMLQQLEDFDVERILMVRLADLPADCLLDSVTEQDRLLPGSTDTVPNTQWLKWLSSVNYEGPLTAYASGAQLAGSTRMQAVEQASDALTQMLASLRTDSEPASSRS